MKLDTLKNSPKYLIGIFGVFFCLFLAFPLSRALDLFPISIDYYWGKEGYFATASVLTALACLLFDYKGLKERFLAISPSDRLPLLCLSLAAGLLYYNVWAFVILMIIYLALGVFQFIKERLGRKPYQFKDKLKEVPHHLWVFALILFLEMCSFLWQGADFDVDSGERYLLMSLLPLSLFLYKPQKSSIQQLPKLLFPILLTVLSSILFYAVAFHLFYVKDYTAWLTDFFNPFYIEEFYNIYSYYSFTLWLEDSHGSFLLVFFYSILIITYYQYIPQKRAIEFYTLLMLCLLFIAFTHQRYMLYVLICLGGIVLLRLIGLDIRRLKMQYYFVLCLLVLGLAYYPIIQNFDPIRKDILDQSLKVIQEMPLLGYGADEEKELLTANPLVKQLHSHNLLLTMMIKFGYIGLTWVLALIWTLYRSIKNNQGLGLFLILSLPLFIIDNPFKSTTIIYSYTWLFFLFALFTQNKIAKE